MVEYVLGFLVIAILAVALRAMYLAQFAFIVRISDGDLRLTRGKVTRAFLQVIQEHCQQHDVRHGWVRGAWRGRRITLLFSRSIPLPCQQQLRNLWLL